MEIRERAKNIIFDTLNYDIFRFEDFTIDQTASCDYVLKISYEKFYFKIQFLGDKNRCNIVFSPGNIWMEDSTTIKISEFEFSIRRVIRTWLEKIKEEILNPLEKRFIDNSIQEFKTEIENKLNEMEDSYFTQEEGNKLKEKLEQIENMILNKDLQEEMQSEILKMQSEIEFLKQTVDTLTKKKWLKNALIKMWVWGQKEENRKLIETGFETVKAISQMDIPKL